MTKKFQKNPPRRKPKEQLRQEYRKSLESKHASETFETEEEPDSDSTGYREKGEKTTPPPAGRKMIINWKKIALIAGAILTIITIMVIFLKGIYMVASIDSSVNNLEKRMDKMDDRFDKYIYERTKR